MKIYEDRIYVIADRAREVCKLMLLKLKEDEESVVNAIAERVYDPSIQVDCPKRRSESTFLRPCRIDFCGSFWNIIHFVQSLKKINLVSRVILENLQIFFQYLRSNRFEDCFCVKVFLYEISVQGDFQTCPVP
jgi:hypothetical protein